MWLSCSIRNSSLPPYRQLVCGPNAIEVEIRPIWKLLFKEVSKSGWHGQGQSWDGFESLSMNDESPRSVVSTFLNFRKSLSEAARNTWKAPGLLKLVGCDITDFSVPLEMVLKRIPVQCSTKVYLIWTLHFHPSLKIRVWNINGSAWRQRGPHRQVVFQPRYSFSSCRLASWFSVCLFVLVNLE